VRADGESRLSTSMNPLANQKLTRYPARHFGDGIRVSRLGASSIKAAREDRAHFMRDGRTLERGRERPLEVGRVGQAASPERGVAHAPARFLLRRVTGSVGGTERRLVVASERDATFVLAEGCRRRAFQKRPVLNVLRTNGLTENEGADRDSGLGPLHRPSAVSADAFVSRAEKLGGQNSSLSLSPFLSPPAAASLMTMG
jgi:hypothetical protein